MKTERNVEARIKNFTPLMDELVKKHGLITAAVWGRVWRYAQQKNRVCEASHETIAEELNISVRTVIRHLQTLTASGYLTDLTPAVRNIPHKYAITDKAKIMITIEGVTESHTNNEEGVSESHTGVTLSPDRYDTKSHEESIKETLKEASKKSDKPKGSRDPLLDNPAVQVYRQVMKLTAGENERPLIADNVTDLEYWRQVCSDWSASGWNKRNIKGLVERYLGNGKQSLKQDSRQSFPAPAGV